ncbi:uncharacterized protein BDR25DRAFT_350732 [Lindgomyces ingoldianus]|uniref:Uncharacterized protein n=1 Tax=Lindgomyces ingoldianus TaxID=673940 RepID=A0ACB6R862_9PLEO|nr:uncharacterized protein BDR25DRAFT_350732 [Lindgomyces ingoldianus]KAF2475346.1 hypothetical protein BDR25DRAFT_350732 [Lindgomyces ingoldianus]
MCSQYTNITPNHKKIPSRTGGRSRAEVNLIQETQAKLKHGYGAFELNTKCVRDSRLHIPINCYQPKTVLSPPSSLCPSLLQLALPFAEDLYAPSVPQADINHSAGCTPKALKDITAAASAIIAANQKTKLAPMGGEISIGCSAASVESATPSNMGTLREGLEHTASSGTAVIELRGLAATDTGKKERRTQDPLDGSVILE